MIGRAQYGTQRRELVSLKLTFATVGHFLRLVPAEHLAAHAHLLQTHISSDFFRISRF